MAFHQDLQTTGKNSQEEIYCHSPKPRRLAEQIVVQGEVHPGQKTLLLCQQMGCVINWNKSELNPTQQLDFVGVHFDLLEGTVQPATEKMDRLMTKVSPSLRNQSIPPHPVVDEQRISSRGVQSTNPLTSTGSVQMLPWRDGVPIWTNAKFMGHGPSRNSPSTSTS